MIDDRKNRDKSVRKIETESLLIYDRTFKKRVAGYGDYKSAAWVRQSLVELRDRGSRILSLPLPTVSTGGASTLIRTIKCLCALGVHFQRQQPLNTIFEASVIPASCRRAVRRCSRFPEGGRTVIQCTRIRSSFLHTTCRALGGLTGGDTIWSS
jgi:hypothetical protein